MESERTQEYLEAIYKRQKKDRLVATSLLAEDLKVSAPAVTDMLRTLEGKGLVKYRAGRGASLTVLGRQQAMQVIRRHRLWERFLTDVLGMKWDKVHEEACKLEHVTSPGIEEGLENVLGDVDTCPHGHSIPDRNGKIKDENSLALSGFQPRQEACISAIDNEDARFLRQVARLGLTPGTCVKVLRKDRDGTITVEANGREVAVPAGVAGSLLAKPAAAAGGVKAKEMPLSKLPGGHSAIISHCGGGRHALGRCLSLGFTPGSTVRMLENFGGGPILVKLHDTEVALGRGVAEKILVQMNT